MATSKSTLFDGLPSLKMPPEMTLDALRVMCCQSDREARISSLKELWPNTNMRTLLNAYVMPTLTDLGLFEGPLATGRPTRYGAAVAAAAPLDAQNLIARQLLRMDERVGFVRWLQGRGPSPRAKAIRDFVAQTHDEEAVLRASRDRLSKWLNYLLHFNVVNEPRSGIIGVDARQVRALLQHDELPSEQIQRSAVLQGYAITSRRVGTRLYVPIQKVRRELGRLLEREHGLVLTDFQLDDILRNAPRLVSDSHRVVFSPFSGPAVGGLQLGARYVGFISIRPRPEAD